MEVATQKTERAKRLPSLWNGEIPLRDRAIDHATLISDENVLLEAYEQVLDYGLCLIENVPPQDGSVVSVAGLFGLVSPSPYADDPAQPQLENIRVDPAVPVNTRKCDFLGPHTDTCWRTSLSGLIYLHCLKSHDKGGKTLLVDGFSVLHRFRESSPDAFDLLASTLLPFKAKVSNGDDWRAQGRIISLDADGEICGIRYSAGSIDWDVYPFGKDHPVTKALSELEACLYSEDASLQIQLQPGDMLAVDNHRVLHGRTAFDPTAGERQLQTCSTRRDEFHNLYRHLARRLGRADWDHDLPLGVI